MVRRVRLGRRDAPSPARKGASLWAGPPRLLIAFTLLGFVVAPFVADDSAAQRPALTTMSASVVSPRSVEPEVVAPKVVYPPAQGGRAGAGVRPVQLKQVSLGVASFNMFRRLTPAQAAQDARDLTRRKSIDIIGWQEADAFTSVLNALPGWETKTFPFAQRSSELAMSWRRSQFRLVSAKQVRVTYGVTATEGRYPFGPRLVAQVTLEHRDTGRRLTVINAHLPRMSEDLDRPGRWRATINAYRARNQLARIVDIWGDAPGRWVIGTGDFNFDAKADARHRRPDGPRRALAETAVSSYERLGVDVPPTFPDNGRRIDYVWVDKDADADGRMRFLSHWVIEGLNSDHNAIVARLRLS